MISSLKENHEIWFEGEKIINYSESILPSTTDVLIIGGGITGITSAYLLSQTNKKVVLLEKNKLGTGVTCRTTGFLTEIIDTDPNKLIKVLGIEKAKLVFTSHHEAIDEIEKIINHEKINCEFEHCSCYIYANSKGEEKRLFKLAEVYKKLGVDAEYKKNINFRLNNFGYIEIKNQAKFNAIKYISSLAEISTKKGVIIVENKNVLSLEKDNKNTKVLIEGTNSMQTKLTIAATYEPFNNPVEFKNKHNMYRSYVWEYNMPQDSIKDGIYNDTLKPYNYFRIDKKNNFDRLIIGGNDTLEVLKITDNVGAKNMEKYAEGLFENKKIEGMRYWSGLISEPVGGLAFIDKSTTQDVFYSFGFSGNGMTYSYIAGKIFFDEIINNKHNPYSDLYRMKKKISWWKKLFW